MPLKVAFIDLHLHLSRYERRERDALQRAGEIAGLRRPTMTFQDRERLRAWFREWREHLWRCYDAQ